MFYHAAPTSTKKDLRKNSSLIFVTYKGKEETAMMIMMKHGHPVRPLIICRFTRFCLAVAKVATFVGKFLRQKGKTGFKSSGRFALTRVDGA